MMKFFNKGLFVSLGLIAAPFAATAETVFMVQLGAFDSEKKAAAHWQSLASTFPDLFDKLNYSPNEVVMKPENFVSYRTQAGPIPTRDEAEGICAALIRSGYECGVSETAMFYSNEAEIVQSNPAAPAIEDDIAPVAAVAAPAPAVAQPVIVPFAKQSAYVAPNYVAPNNVAPQAQPIIMGSAPQNLATQVVPDAPVAGGAVGMQVQGTIAAEEAIPVPLSNAAPAANPYLERGNLLMEAHPSDNSRINSYWADISFFSNEIAAAQYVRSLKTRDNMLPPQLRVRITRPYGVVTGNERLSLRVGPFLTTRPIMRLCALTRQDNLRCRAVKDMGGSVRNTDRYSNRRGARAVTTSYAGYRGSANISRANGNVAGGLQNRQSGSYLGANMSSNVGGAYYVQLGSFLSPEAAGAKWSQLQARHGGVLSSVQNDVMLPNQGSSASRLFRLRAGPFASMNAAYALCGQLKAQGTLCIVVK